MLVSVFPFLRVTEKVLHEVCIADRKVQTMETGHPVYVCVCVCASWLRMQSWLYSELDMLSRKLKKGWWPFNSIKGRRV